MMPDHINAVFELVGAAVTWVNFNKLRRDRSISGVDWRTWIFFSAWGLWNLYYYPSLGQSWSFYAGIVLVTGNLAWLLLAIVIWYQKERAQILKRYTGCPGCRFENSFYIGCKFCKGRRPKTDVMDNEHF